MTTATTMPVSRGFALVAGTILGSACAWFAYSNGVKSAPGFDGMVLGAVGASCAVLSWFCLPLAAAAKLDGDTGRARVLVAGWVLLTVFVLMNAIGFTAHHRKERVGGAEMNIEAYDRAKARLVVVEAELETAKQSKKWVSTKSCTDATVEASIAFCGGVTVIKSNIATYENILKAGRPASADAEAEAFAPLGISATLFANWKPILWALVQELAMSLAFYAGLRPRRKDEVVAQPVRVEVAKAVAAPVEKFDGHVAAYRAARDQEAARVAEFLAVLEEFTHQLPSEEFKDIASREFKMRPAAPATEVVPLPEAVVEAKPTERVAKRKGKVVKQPRRMRDNNGRFAPKAKLVSVTAEPVAPRLSDLPTLAGAENVVVLGKPKK